MAYQVAQTPATLNDHESHFSYMTLLTRFLGQIERSTDLIDLAYWCERAVRPSGRISSPGLCE